MGQRINNKQLRSFGLTVGAIFGLIGLWPALLQRGSLRFWALVLAGLLIVPAVAFPRILAPVRRGWMTLGNVLGWINTRIIMAVIFFLVVTPMGWMMRALGKDPMQRRFEPNAESYRINKGARPAAHMKKQY